MGAEKKSDKMKTENFESDVYTGHTQKKGWYVNSLTTTHKKLLCSVNMSIAFHIK